MRKQRSREQTVVGGKTGGGGRVGTRLSGVCGLRKRGNVWKHQQASRLCRLGGKGVSTRIHRTWGRETLISVAQHGYLDTTGKGTGSMMLST